MAERSWLLVFVILYVVEAGIPNMQLAQKALKPFNLAGIYSFDQISTWLADLKNKHTFVTLRNLGVTYQNRSLTLVTIDPSRSAEKPGQSTSPMPAIFIDAGTHARELITVSIALNLINEIVDATTRNESSELFKVVWYILPVVNPDGYEYARTIGKSWRKNRSPNSGGCIGVDLNRNWDHQWGLDVVGSSRKTAEEPLNSGSSWGSWLLSALTNPEKAFRQVSLSLPCSELYAGDSAFSEIESKAVARLLTELKNQTSEINLITCISLHSMTGNQVLIFPYGYTSVPTPHHVQLNRLAGQMVEEMFKATERRYTYGSIASTMYQTTGLQADWIYAKLGVNLTFVFEFRDNLKTDPVKLIENGFLELLAGLRTVVHYAI